LKALPPPSETALELAAEPETPEPGKTSGGRKLGLVMVREAAVKSSAAASRGGSRRRVAPTSAVATLSKEALLTRPPSREFL
jgi:hypothetical protein